MFEALVSSLVLVVGAAFPAAGAGVASSAVPSVVAAAPEEPVHVHITAPGASAEAGDRLEIWASEPKAGGDRETRYTVQPLVAGAVVDHRITWPAVERPDGVRGPIIVRARISDREGGIVYETSGVAVVNASSVPNPVVLMPVNVLRGRAQRLAQVQRYTGG